MSMTRLARRQRVPSEKRAISLLLVAGIPLWVGRDPISPELDSIAVQEQICSPDIALRAVVERDSAGIRIVESAAGLTVPQITFRVAEQPSITIGGPDNYRNFFSRVGPATRLSTGSIVVADLSEMRLVVFNARSETVRQIGRKGQGPGEFERISSLLRLPGDTLLVADSPGRRLTYLRSDGSLIRVVDISNLSLPRAVAPSSSAQRPIPATISVVARFHDGSFLLSTVRPGGWGTSRTSTTSRSTLHLHWFDPLSQRTDTVGEFGQQPIFTLAPSGVSVVANGYAPIELPFAPVGSFAAIADGYYETMAERYELRKKDIHGRVVRIDRWCKAPVPLTAAEIGRWRAVQNPNARADYKRWFAEAADRVQHPRTKPAFTKLLVDSEQRIWAREFGLEMDQPIYHVFDSNGRYLTNVRMPRDVEILEIGRDYVLAQDINEDDIDRILVYPLQQVPRQ